MRVLHVINSVSIGGAENILLNSIEGFQKYWPESKHILLVLYGSSTDERLEYFDKVHFLKTNLKKLIFKAPRLLTLIKKIQPDIIHTHLWDALIVGRFVSNTKVNLIHTYHSIDYAKGELHHSPWRIFLDKITYQSTPIAYVSESVREAVLSQIPKQKQHGKVVHNFCTEDFRYTYNSHKNATLKLVAVGNLKEVKNYDLLLDGILDVHGIELDIYGEGDLKDHLSYRVKKQNLNVNLKGRAIITSDLLSHYDAFVMSSIREGMPVALLEAMTSGLPSVLPSHLPVMKELAGDSAWYFRNSGELSSILATLDRSELGRKSKIAHKRSKSYNLETYVKKLREIYVSQR